LDSSRTSAYIDQSNRVWVRQGADPFISYDNVAQIRWRTQPGFILGFSPVMLAANSVAANLGLVRMASTLARNVSQPAIFLEYPGVLAEPAWENIRKSWQELHSGDNAFGLGLIEEGMKVSKLPLPSAADSEMTAALEWSASDFARLFSIPPSLLGL
jgi:phage portal protein BeeE